jgi:AraC-like DNA-binding protein
MEGKEDSNVSTQETQYSCPSLAASRFVRCYIQRKGCSGAVIVTIPVIARSCALLDVELGDMLQIRSCSTGLTRQVEPMALVGLETYVQNHLLVHGNSEIFQIQFRPAALKQLFGLPMPELTNQNHAACGVLGSQVSALRQRLGEAYSFEERVQLANAFIVELSSDRPANNWIELAASEILRSQGNCKIDQLAHDTGFSMRNFQRRFRECVGISPKLYARLVRFESVLKAKAAAPQRSWMNAAHEVGYYDQMHMIHDFREFSGGTPTDIFGHAEQAFTPHADFGQEARAR